MLKLFFLAHLFKLNSPMSNLNLSTFVLFVVNYLGNILQDFFFLHLFLRDQLL